MNIIIKFYIPKIVIMLTHEWLIIKIISRETVDDYDDIYG